MTEIIEEPAAADATEYVPPDAARSEYQQRLITDGHKPGVLSGKSDKPYQGPGVYIGSSHSTRRKLFERLSQDHGIAVGYVKNPDTGEPFLAWTKEGRAVRLKFCE